MIPKDVVICDWHYERPDHTPVYFAMKGFRVITFTGRKPETSVSQAENMAGFRKNTTKEMKPRYYGMMHSTVNNQIMQEEGQIPLMLSKNCSGGLMSLNRRNKHL